MAKIGTVQKENNKHLILHLAVICLIFIGANIALTQRIAHLYGHHDALGPPLWGHYYLPWKWVVWASMYYETAKVAFDQAFVWVGVISALIFGTYAFIAAYAGMKGRAYKDLHGSAHFASKKEIRQTGLLAATSGVYVGAWEDKNKQVHYLRHDGPEHFLAFAPTRSGKGVGLVIPTLLSWPESVICLDIKGENWEMTSSWRKKHANNIVLKFDPTSSDGSAARFNPLDEIRLDTDMDVSDTQNIVEMLSIPDEKTGKEDPHFTPSGKAFLVGALLHFAYKAKREGEKISLPELTEQLSSLPFDELLDEMQHFPHRDGAVYGLVFQTAQDMLDRALLQKNTEDVKGCREEIAIQRDRTDFR